MKVPDILLSGNHKEIKDWRENQMKKRTIERRNVYFQMNKNISAVKIIYFK